MKKNIIMLLAATLLVVAGCKKDDNKDNNANGEKMTFTSNLGGGAKTAITGKDMIWTDDDQIIINGKTFYSEIFDEGRLAKFTGGVVEPVYQAFYPIGIYKGENSYELPAIQFRDGDNLSGVNPMYACSENTTLDFHNICALVKLDLTGTCSVASIEAKAEQPLSGAFSIEGNKTDGYYAKLTSEDPAATVILNCGNLGVQLNETTFTTFYIALPKGNYTNLTFTVTDTEDKTADVKQEGIAMLEAGSLWNKQAEVSFPFTFTVADGKTVEFAPGNLWYGVADGESTPAFHFENNQWDFALGSYNTDWDYYDWNPDHVSHFYWSKTASEAYAPSYNDSDASTTDVFFTNDMETTANPSFQVSGETAGTWRTLSKDEWSYLLRRGENSLWAWVTLTDVNVNGLVLLPDGSKATASEITTTSMLAEAGAVFLPATGFRNDNRRVDNVGLDDNNWSSTPSGNDKETAFCMTYYNNPYTSSYGRFNGSSVRLVR